MKYEIMQRVFLIKKYYELKSVTLVQRAWRAEYKSKDFPSRSSILSTISNFEKTGSVESLPPKRNGPSQKREEAKIELKAIISEHQTLSIRKAASIIGVSATLVHSILHDDLHLKPYKYQHYHKLEEGDGEKRVIFAKWFLSLPYSAKLNLICCDEAYFYLTQTVNKQNNRMWAETNPKVGIEEPLHDSKLLVWVAISADKVQGVYFFEGTVNKENYLNMLRFYFWKKIENVYRHEKYYFLQDGATPHTATTVQTFLKAKFQDKFIDKSMWPPRSPDLNPLDFYLWGYLKDRVYNPLPYSLDELKANILREIEKIDKNDLYKVFVNFEKRLDLIISAKGGHIEDK